MLQIQENYAKKENYVISESKSTVLSINSKESEEFILNKGNNKITELRTILQRESQNS